MHFVTSINYQTKEQDSADYSGVINAQLMQDRMNFLPSVKQVSLGMSLVWSLTRDLCALWLIRCTSLILCHKMEELWHVHVHAPEHKD